MCKSSLIRVILTKKCKKNKFGHFLVVVQLIRQTDQADISCTTTACLFFFLLFDPYSGSMTRLSLGMFNCTGGTGCGGNSGLRTASRPRVVAAPALL